MRRVISPRQNRVYHYQKLFDGCAEERIEGLTDEDKKAALRLRGKIASFHKKKIRGDGDAKPVEYPLRDVSNEVAVYLHAYFGSGQSEARLHESESGLVLRMK